jgi:hypothetical protein
MARHPYTFLAGDLSGWPVGTTPTPRLLQRLDQFSSELVNGVDGGSWAPVDPIVIGPQAIETIVLSTAGSVLAADIETVKGNRPGVMGQPGLVLLGTPAPLFQTPRTRDVVVPFSFWSESNVNAGEFDAGWYRYELDPLTLGARSTSRFQAVLPDVVAIVPLPIRAQHRGATIASIDFRYRIGQRRVALPTTQPKFRAIRVHRDDLALPLHTNAGGYDVQGWLIETAADINAYYNGGNTKTITYTPNQNHANIDPDTHFWAVQWIDDDAFLTGDESIGNTFLSATIHLTNIIDLRQE